MKKGIKWIMAGLLAAGTAAGAYAAPITVDWGGTDYTGLALANGTPLPTGDLVEIGSFSVAPVPGSYSLANFTVFATGLIGDYDLPAGFWGTDASTADAAGFAHQQIYLVAFNASTPPAASTLGIFTSSESNWIFPASSDVPNSTFIDLENLVSNPDLNTSTLATNGTIITGNGLFHSTDFGGSTYLELGTIPEPSSLALAVAGLLGLISISLRHCN